jgi:sulfide:quinone oxidoreductase
MTAARAYDMQVEVSIAVATPEDAPLAIFGEKVSEAVEHLLDDKGIMVLCSAQCSVPKPGLVIVHPSSRELRVDRVVALPQLFGPSPPGVPTGTHGGFIPVDVHGRVRGFANVFAAGDATNFAVKHGGIAAHQADTAATAIAALAGALGGDKPLYLSAHVTGSHGSDSEVGDKPTWSPATKIVAKYLAPYLESREHQKAR